MSARKGSANLLPQAREEIKPPLGGNRFGDDVAFAYSGRLHMWRGELNRAEWGSMGFWENWDRKVWRCVMDGMERHPKSAAKRVTSALVTHQAGHPVPS
jgi:hypothetical protein